jgi:hypothetical protein
MWLFAPMKKWWEAIVTDWKEECSQNGTNYATIPKQVILHFIGTGTVSPYRTFPTVLYLGTGNYYILQFLSLV